MNETKKIVQDLIIWKHPDMGTLTPSEERTVIESVLATVQQRPQDFDEEVLKSTVPEQYTKEYPGTPKIYKTNPVANILWNLTKRSSELVMIISGFEK